MSVRALQRVAQIAVVLTAVAIAYVTLAPAPPHWGTVLPPAPSAAAQGIPPSLSPPPGLSAWEEEAIGHALLFFVLGAGASLWYATSEAARRAPQRTLVMTMLLLWLFGGVTEAAQGLTATRSPQLADLAFDVLGALLGFVAGGLFWRLLLTRSVRGPRPSR